MFVPEWIIGAFGGMVGTIGFLAMLTALKAGQRNREAGK